MAYSTMSNSLLRSDDKGCDFHPEPLVLNAKTIAAIEEARAGGLKRYATVAEMMADLDADGAS